MSQVFKALKDFEFNNKQIRAGEEIVCTAREGEALAKVKTVAPSDRELDPNDKKDKALIDECQARKMGKHQEKVDKEEAREEEKQVKMAEKDEAHAAKVADAKKLAKEKGEDETKLEALTEAELEVEVDRLKGVVKPKDKEDIPDDEPVPATKPKAKKG